MTFIKMHDIIALNVTLTCFHPLWPNVTVSIDHMQLSLNIWSSLYKQFFKAQMMFQFWVSKYKISSAGIGRTM